MSKHLAVLDHQKARDSPNCHVCYACINDCMHIFYWSKFSRILAIYRWMSRVNTFSLEQNGHTVQLKLWKAFYINQTIVFWSKFYSDLCFGVGGLIHNESALEQIMACCRHITNLHRKQFWQRYIAPYGIIRPQWVNKYQLISMSLSRMTQIRFLLIPDMGVILGECARREF